MQVAFRVKTDAAILGAGIVLAGGADAYPAPPATSRQHPKLTASFSPQTRNATCGSPPWRDAMDFRCSCFHRILFTRVASTVLILTPAFWMLFSCPAVPETPASRDKRKIAFSYQHSDRNGSPPNACHGSPHFVQHKMIFWDNGQQAGLICKGIAPACHAESRLLNYNY